MRALHIQHFNKRTCKCAHIKSRCLRFIIGRLTKTVSLHHMQSDRARFHTLSICYGRLHFDKFGSQRDYETRSALPLILICYIECVQFLSPFD